MKLATPAQMKQIDALAINKIGIPGIVLMENAALKVVEEVIGIFGDISSKTIAVFAGKGNNGGDAFAVARHLFNKGANVKVYIMSQQSDIKGDAKINLDILAKIGVQTSLLIDNWTINEVGGFLLSSDIIIDGIFGTGLKGKIQSRVKEVIDLINSLKKYTISIDIPSGLDGETGEILGSCIKADKTVTFVLPKKGLTIYPGCDYTGELVIADIGIPQVITNSVDIKLNLIDNNLIKDFIPKRYSISNKGDYGKVFILSGSPGMTGAGCLTARAALRTGAGLIYIGVPAILSSVYDASLTEAVTIPLPDGGSGYLVPGSLGQIMERVNRSTVAAIGPGLSVNENIVQIVHDIIENSNIPLVIDADALNAVSKDISVLARSKAEIILTPHPGEMSRLTGISIEEIQKRRLQIAHDFAAEWKVIVVLKGSRTVIADPLGNVFINPTGNSGMATGGTGDVLTGIIAGLTGQGAKAIQAAVAGVYLHGLAGDAAAKIKGEYGMIASDLVEEIPFSIKNVIEVKI
jgi:ADP-dependent NAD(P)H-hydrate dehydratase / NAD(P)H-hydrate epimerase